MKRWQKNLAVSLQTPVAKEWIRLQNTEQRAFRAACNKCPDKIVPIHWADIQWTAEARMTTLQVQRIESLPDTKIWATVQHKITGASAIVLRYEQHWILCFEDGSVTSGIVPVFPKVWPVRLKRKDFQAAKSLVFTGSTFSISRY